MSKKTITFNQSKTIDFGFDGEEYFFQQELAYNGVRIGDLIHVIDDKTKKGTAKLFMNHVWSRVVNVVEDSDRKWETTLELE